MASAPSHFATTPSVRRYGQPDGDILLASLLINLLSLCLPLAMMQIFNRVIPNGSTGTLAGIYVVLAAYVAVDIILKTARLRLFMSASARAERATARQVFDGLFRIRMPELRKIGQDALAEQLGQLRDIGKRNSGLLMASRLDLLFTTVFVAVIFALAPMLAMVSLLCTITVAAWTIRIRTKFRAASQMRRVNDTRRGSFLIEVFGLTSEVKLLGIEQVLLRRYEMLQKSASDASESLIRINAAAATVAAIVGQAATGLVSVVGAYLVITDEIGLAELAATILLTGRTVQPVIQALFVDMDLEILGQTRAQFDTLTTRHGPARLTLPDTNGSSAGPVAIRFDQVTLREPWSGASLLEKIDITLHAGSLTVLNGRSDAPADLVLRLIAGEILPAAGRVMVGRRLPGRSDRIVYISHATDIHEGSVVKNLTAFRGRSHETEPLRVGRLLGLEQDVRLLPGGYQHVLARDSRGHGSQGLYDKVRLARGLAIPAGVYLLDRPFDGLDPTSQRRLRDHLRALRGRATVVVSAAPPWMADDADLTLTLRPDLPLRIAYNQNAAAPDDVARTQSGRLSA